MLVPLFPQTHLRVPILRNIHIDMNHIPTLVWRTTAEVIEREVRYTLAIVN